MYKHLFSPFKIGNVEIKNRITMAPMGEGQPDSASGAFTYEDQEYFARRAAGGVGLIFTGAVLTDTEVDPYTMEINGIKSIQPSRMIINHNPFLFRMMTERMVTRLHSLDAKVFLQLTAGFGRNMGHKSSSPNPHFMNPNIMVPAMTKDEIQAKIKYMAMGAKIAKDTGFDGVEVHALHFGYLLDQFSIAFYNKREDEYGGSFENRHRIVAEMREAIAKECGADFPVTMRLSIKSYMKGFNTPSLHGDGEVGRTLEEGLEICRFLEENGYDGIGVDSGTYDSIYRHSPPMYQPMGLNVELAAEAKKAVKKIPIMVGGRMNDPDLCERAIKEGKVDAVAIGRGLMADPDFAIKALRGKPETIRPCLACYCCTDRLKRGLYTSCAVNPECMYETTFQITPALVKKNVMVVGAGIAGLEVARVAGLRGHKVEVYEKSGAIGGNLIPAGKPSFKEDDHKLIRYYGTQMDELGIPVHLNCEVTMDMVKEKQPDVIVTATGSHPIVPDMAAACKNAIPCVSCTDALLGNAELGDSVIVVGGGLVGCELALSLAQNGKKVTVVEAMPQVLSTGKPIALPNKLLLLDLLEDIGVTMLTGHTVDRLCDGGAVVCSDDTEKTITADSLVWAVGFRAENRLAQELKDAHYEVHNVGDSNKVANIQAAIWDGYEVGRCI